MKNKAWKFEALRTIIALGISFIILLVIILFVSDEPLIALQHLFLGPISSKSSFFDVINRTIPLIFTGVGMALIFSADSLNLATESAVFIGALSAATVAIKVSGPRLMVILLALLIGALIGAILTGIPAFLKMTTNSDEMVVSLMLNYIMVHLGIWFLNKFIKDYQFTGNASLNIPQEMMLTKLGDTRVHTGIFIAIVVVILAYLAMYKTPWGLKVRITGANKEFAKFAGIAVPMTALSTQVIGGALAGLGGAVEQLGNYRRFRWDSSPEYGWDGILIATLARNNPGFVPLAAFFLAYLRVGAEIMNRRTDVPPEILQVIQGVIIILIVADKLIARIKQRVLYKEAKESIEGLPTTDRKGGETL